MPQPFDYRIQPVDVGNYFDAFRQGRTDRREAAAETRSDYLRQFLGPAYQGDEAAQAEVFKIDPEVGVRMQDRIRQQSDADLQRNLKMWDIGGGVLRGVKPGDTEGFERAKFSLRQIGVPSQFVDSITPEQVPALVQFSPTAQQHITAELDRRGKEAGIRANDAQTAKYRADAADGPGEAGLAGPTLDFMADQYLAGDRSVLMNLGRGRQGAKNVVALRDRIAEKATAAGVAPQKVASVMAEFEGYKSGQRALGTRTANLGMAVNEAYQMADLVTDASANVSRSQFTPINVALQAFQSRSGSPEQVKFGASLNSFINAYARAINPTGQPTISDKDHAREMLATAQSHEQVQAVIDQLKLEMDAAQRSPGLTREELQRTFSGNSGAQGGHGTPFQPNPVQRGGSAPPPTIRPNDLPRASGPGGQFSTRPAQSQRLQEGQTGTSKSGRPMIVRNGQWTYQ